MEKEIELKDTSPLQPCHKLIPFQVAPLMILTGHYGVGKTNLSLNIAVDIAASGKHVTLIDLDIVNPYFRSSDYEEPLKKRGVDLIAPVFARSNVDVPSVSGAIYPALENANDEHIVIVDTGGDDAGATALGRFAGLIRKNPYHMYYVINQSRNLTQKPQEAAKLLQEIETASGLEATGVINNSHLMEFTTNETLEQSVVFAQESAKLMGLTLSAMTVPIDEKCDESKSFIHFPSESTQTRYFVRVYVNTPWEKQGI